MEYILKGGLVIDPGTKTEKKMDLHIAGDRIKAVGADLTGRDVEIIDMQDKIIAPGFIDMHVHLREPGGEAHETILTGCRAAAAGGFTALAAMPNTKPCADNEAVIELVKNRAKAVGLTKVMPIGTISKGQQGQEISEIGNLCKAGAVAISDDGKPVSSSEVMRRALEYTKIFGIPVISHCEDLSLAGEGVMHEGFWSTLLGLRGIPAQAEETMVARDLLLARLTGGRLHLAHLSTKGSIELLRYFKSQGVNVTAEATPHHLLLTDEEVKNYNTAAKVNPPLRSPEHVAAVRKAVGEGLIQCIATDHAPWSKEDKEQEFNLAPNGLTGMETAVAVAWDTLVAKGGLAPAALIARFTEGPAQALNLAPVTITAGGKADLTVIDPNIKKTVDPQEHYSKGRNCPFKGRSFQGWPVMTIIDGRIVMRDGRIIEGQ